MYVTGVYLKAPFTITNTTMNKVYIAIPTKEGQVYFELMIRLLSWSHSSIPITVNFKAFSAPIDHCRNEIVQDFLKSDCTHLFMIDDDIVPPEDALERLLFHDKEIVSAVCPLIGPGSRRQLSVTYNAYIKDIEGDLYQYDWPDSSGLEEVYAVGTGCIMLKRSILEVTDYPFKTEYDSKGIKFMGEDISFCVNAKEAGHQVFADYKLKCKHIKSCNLLEI